MPFGASGPNFVKRLFNLLFDLTRVAIVLAR
jgi:hypothetical protein